MGWVLVSFLTQVKDQRGYMDPTVFGTVIVSGSEFSGRGAVATQHLDNHPRETDDRTSSSIDRIDRFVLYKTTLFTKRLLTDLYALSGGQRKKVTPAKRGKGS
jgi:hypothetical protein